MRPFPRFVGTVWEAVAVGAAVLAAHVALRASSLFLLGAFNDDGVYVSLGKALAGGHGYRLIYLVGEPVAVKYPPGLPALLAVPWALGGALAQVRALVAVLHPTLCGVTAGLLWWLGRGRMGLPPLLVAIPVVGALLLEPSVQFYNMPLAEPYLLCAWAAALVITDRLGDDPKWGLAAALGLLLAGATLFRTLGVALIPAFLAALAIRRRPWPEVATCAAAAIAPLAVWRVAHAAVMARGPLAALPDETSYLAWLQLDRPVALMEFVALQVAENLAAYIQSLAAMLSGTRWLGFVVLGAAAVAAALGAGLQWRRRPALVLTVVTVAGAVLVWPYTQARLLLPVLPVAGLLVAAGLHAAHGWTPRRWRAAGAVALAAVTVIGTLRQAQLRRTALEALATRVQPAWDDVSPTYMMLRHSLFITGVIAWVRANTTPADRIVVDAPSAVYLYTGRHTMPASPAEPSHAPSVFDVPGQYLATRVLEDSVTVVALGRRGYGLEADIRRITAVCPGVLDSVAVVAAGGLPVFFRVSRDETCLRTRVLR